MQTFLPYADFDLSAKALDTKRLGKQRVETYQILNTLGVNPYKPPKGKGWANHPAVLMWERHEYSLCNYGISMCKEWAIRGYNDTLLVKILDIRASIERNSKNLYTLPPYWFGDEQLHASHRSNLLRKNPDYYAHMNWAEPDNLPYFWPVRKLRR